MPAIFYSHPRLIQLIQQRHPEYDDALDAVQDAQTLVRDMRQALMQAEQQLAQAQAQLRQTIPAQQERCQLVRELQAMQRACWNRTITSLAGCTIACRSGSVALVKYVRSVANTTMSYCARKL